MTEPPSICGALVPASAFFDEVLVEIERSAKLGPFADRVREAPGWAERLNALRAFYREYEKLHGPDYAGCDPYESGAFASLTPIEYLLWQDLRGQWRTPVVMQYPVGPYVLDFACPSHRIALEADGKAFHDPERDAWRDSILWREHGWKVYRVSGSECYRNDPSPEQFAGDYYEREDEDPPEAQVRRAAQAFFATTSTGVARAIRCLELGEADPGPYGEEMRASLETHRLVGFRIGQ
ncbi:MAG: DUF559 domain-containing protein [Steroidobacteraceae bacterium]|nr:DUF559 domain-containing protein [Steroidobacteraceae bacterium]